MAQTEILSSVIRTGSYPVSTQVSAPYSCGTLILSLGSTPWTNQMIHELPTINIQIFTLAGEKYASFDIDMSTVNENINPVSPTDPYFIAIYDVPSDFNFKVTPLFDHTAISSHNNTIENGIVDFLPTSSSGIVTNENTSGIWTTETSIFTITITFDNENISSSGSGGGGGGSSATDITYSNTLSGLTATNVQDAIDELALNPHTVTITDYPITLSANSWNSGEYIVQNNKIKSDSIIYINVPGTITEAQYTSLALADIVCTTQANGYITLKATGITPTIDIPIIVSIQS